MPSNNGLKMTAVGRATWRVVVVVGLLLGGSIDGRTGSAGWRALLLGGAASVGAQTPAAPGSGAGSKPAGPAAPGEIREAKPDVYYVRDKDGNLVPVPDFSYEEFKRLYDLDRKLSQAAAPPAFVLQSLAVEGKVEGKAGDDSADLTVKLRWAIKSDAWVRIPLRFNSAVLREVPTYDGPGEQFVEAERGGGFVAWVRESDAAPHTLTMRLRAPLRRQGEERQMSLPTPAATLSELRLTVPQPRLTASASGGGTLTGNSNPAPGSTLLEAAGLGEAFQLAWRPRDAGAARTIGAVEAVSSVEVRVEGPRRATSEARIKLRGVSPALEAFRVRLPAGMEFVPAIEPGYTVEPVETGPAAGGRTAQVVEVKLESRGGAPPEIRLRASTPATSKAGPDEPMETLGFEVLGAVRQSGQVEFTVDGDWSLNFMERANVQPAELSDAARQQGVAARFEFYRQPCSLTVQVQARKSRVQVEPTYVLTVGATQVRLQANLNYRLRGPIAPRLQVDCTGWSVDRVEPERLTGVATPSPESPGILTIPLGNEPNGPARDFEIQLFAHLDTTPGQPLSLPIPRPLIEGPSSAVVVIAPEDNVSVSPKPAEMAGMVPEPLPPTLNLPARLQAPLYYRVRLDAEPKRFAADVRLRPCAMSVDVRHRLRVAAGELRSEHRLRYLVANEPVDRVRIAWNGGAAPSTPPQFLLDTGAGPAVPLVSRPLGDDPSSVRPAAAGGRPTWELMLPEPRSGAFTVVIRAAWRLAVDDAAAPVEFAAPLPLPVSSSDTTIVGNRLSLAATPPWRVELSAQDWRSASSGGRAESGSASGSESEGESEAFDEDPSALHYRGAETSETARLRLGAVQAGQGAFWVRNAWVQTWLGHRTRHDRCVWRLVANHDRFLVRPPTDVRTDDLVAAVDGVRTPVEVDAEGRLSIRVPSDGGEHVVELSMFVPRRGGRGGLERLELPSIVEANRATRFLWQFVTPRDEHLLFTPRGLTPELKWGWRNGIWERQATWSQAELERWSGGAAQEPLPAETNQYLFSAVGDVEAVELRLAPRAWLVIGASTAALAIGLGLLYLRPLRHPLIWTAGGALLASLAASYPESAVVAAQAALLGAALALLARVLRGAAPRRSAAPAVRVASRSSVSRATETLPAPVVVEPLEPPGTTATASPPFPLTAANKP